MIAENTIQLTIFDSFLNMKSFTLKEAEESVLNNISVNKPSIRARIYEGIEKGIFEKVSRGVYKVVSQLGNQTVDCLMINGDGRDLSMIEDASIDGIVTDHPYDLSKALKGGNRKFATYELFKYTLEDFKEKYRVLKDGAFLVEFLPEESEVNYEYLYEIKQMAKEAGFKYYSKVPWKKGDFVSNTGRKAKNVEDVLFFTKGEPRALKPDNKKNLATAKKNNLNIKNCNSMDVAKMLKSNGLEVSYMKGTNGMLPTVFDFAPRSKKDKIMEAEKPVALLESILGYISRPFECILDQFAGSGNLGVACRNLLRSCILIEKDKDTYNKIIANIG